MNWFQRLAARWILGKEWAGWIDGAMRSLGKGEYNEAIAASIEENPLKRFWIAASLQDEPKVRIERGISDRFQSAPSCVHFRPTMSVDDIGLFGVGHNTHVVVNGRSVPLIPDGYVRFGAPKATTWRNSWGGEFGKPIRSIPPILGPDGKILPEHKPEPKDPISGQSFSRTVGIGIWERAPDSRPRHDVTDPAYLGDMPPHMPYDWP